MSLPIYAALGVNEAGTVYVYDVGFANLQASAAPGVGDDQADNYAPGSLWIDKTADSVYVCVDSSTGAAVWRRCDNAGVDLSSYLTSAAAAAAYQPLDGDLTALAALSGTNTIYYRSAANTWTAVTIGTGVGFSGGTLSATGSGGDVTAASTIADNAVVRGDGGAKGVQTSGASVDDDGNLAANNLLPGYAATVTAAGTTTLTSASARVQYFTGGTTQTVVLPVTATLTLGHAFEVVNNSSGVVTVQSSGTNAVLAIDPQSRALFVCVSTSGSSASSWDAKYTGKSFVTGSGSLVLSVSPSLTTPNLGTPSAGTLTNCTGFQTVNLSGTITNAQLAGSIDLTAKVTGILPTANGGTASAFFTVSGPATSAKTFTFPNASSVVLTDNAAVTVAQGGTGRQTLTNHGVLVGAGTSAVTQLAVGTDGQILVGQSSADPAFTTLSGAIALTAAGVASVSSGYLRGEIDGLILSDNGSGSTTLNYAAGACRDSTDAYNLILAAGTKLLAATWASGSGGNGLDTGSVTNSTWYHVFAISKAAGADPDLLFSLSAGSPTMPSTYTLKRRIGSVLTNGSGKITQFKQDGDEFQWLVPVADVNGATNPGTSAVTRTLTVPTNVRVKALMSVVVSAVATTDCTGSVLISDLSITDTAPTVNACNFYMYSSAAATFQLGGQVSCYTNTSAQVRSRLQVSAAGTALYLNTLGWIDSRGRNG